jgi:uncharacterized protein YlzI (FlbEa/FlbD family)
MWTRTGISGLMLSLLTLLMFTRLDGHKVWIDPVTGMMVEGAGQVGYPTGTLITTGSKHVVVQENVNEVVRKFNAYNEPAAGRPADTQAEPR